MKHQYYKEFNENVYYKELANGLKVYLIPKTDYNKTFVTFTTNYGSFDQSFIPIGKDHRVNQPAGIAHFLEHKLFAMPDKTDAFEKLSSFGVSANAFTSFDKTTYLFSGTSNIKEALEYLLDFVQTPYFTPSSVKKEQGIIVEEALMYQDYPSQRLMYGLFKNMYKNHPLNTEIIGTVDSIYKITANKLYEAYYTFYHPSNMVLTIIGNFDYEEMFTLVKANQERKDFKKEAPVKRFLPNEPKKIVNPHTEIAMSVNMPYFGMSFKLEPKEEMLELYKQGFALDILLKLYLSSSSTNYANLLKKGLINQSFNFMPMEIEGALSFIVTSMTNDVNKLSAELKKILVNIKRKTIDEESFNREKKVLKGDFIRELNNLESFNISFMSTLPYGITLFDVPDLIESITITDLLEIAKAIVPNKMTTFVINPQKA